MDPIHLRPNELAYELDIRGVVGLTSQRLKTSRLREILKRESLGTERAPTESADMYNADYELEMCRNNLIELKEIVKEAIQNNKSLGITESENRLMHYSERLHRIKLKTIEDKDDSNKLQNLISQIRRDIQSFHNTSRPRNSLPIQGAASLLLANETQRLGAVSTNNIFAQFDMAETFNTSRPQRSNSPINTDRVLQNAFHPNFSSERNINEVENEINNIRISPVVSSDIFENTNERVDRRTVARNDTNYLNHLANQQLATRSVLPPGTINAAQSNLNNIVHVPETVQTSRVVFSNFNQAQIPMGTQRPPENNNSRQHLRYDNISRPHSPRTMFNHIDNIMTLDINRNNEERYPYHRNTNDYENQFRTQQPTRYPDRLPTDRPNLDYRANVRDQHDRPFPQFEGRTNSMHRRSIPVNQWRVSFNGEGPSTELHEFLDQVALFQRSEHFSNEDLMYSIIHLLTGRARLWYLSVHDSFRSWADLVEAMKREFLPINYQYSFLSEISNRRQRENESIGEYITHMQSLFKWSNSQIPEAHKLHIVRNNLLSKFAIAIAPLEIYNLHHLSEICRRIDGVTGSTNQRTNTMPFQKSYQNQRWNQNARSNNVNMIDNELNSNVVSEATNSGIINSTNPFDVYAMAQGDHRSQNIQNKPSENQNKIISVCYNCNKLGHVFRFCSEARAGLFCYSCGMRNVISRNCTRCTGNGWQGSGNRVNLQNPNSNVSNPTL